MIQFSRRHFSIERGERLRLNLLGRKPPKNTSVLIESNEASKQTPNQKQKALERFNRNV
jgi:hypothetical protein